MTTHFSTTRIPDHWVDAKLGGLHTTTVRAEITVDLSRLTKPTKTRLLKALETGIMDAATGHTAWHYNFFAYIFGWPPAHLIGKGKYSWTSIRIFARHTAMEEIQPALLIALPDGMKLRKMHWWESQRVDNTSGYTIEGDANKRDELRRNFSSQLVRDTLIQHDQRDASEVQRAIQMVQGGETITLTGETA